MLRCLITVPDTSPFRWPWLAARPRLGNPCISSIFSRSCAMLYFHFLTSSSPEQVQVWSHRHQQKCYHGVFTPSEHGWLQGCMWSPTKWMGGREFKEVENMVHTEWINLWTSEIRYINQISTYVAGHTNYLQENHPPYWKLKICGMLSSILIKKKNIKCDFF